MFDYWFDDLPTDVLQSNSAVIWDLNSLLPVAPGLLTPFSYSVVAEIMRRGWFQYYDRLGFEPTPGAKLVRQHRGYAYLNTSISARMESNAAAVEPSLVHLNGAPFPLADWEKPGLLGGIKSSRSQKQIDNLLKEFSIEVVASTQKAKEWYENLLTLKWSQADILQVMEQIERVGSDSLMIFFGAQHNLGLLYNRLYRATVGAAAYPRNMQQIVAACSDATGLVEQEMIEQVGEIRRSLVASGQSTEFRARCASFGRENTGSGNKGDAEESALLETLWPFLRRFGHRGLAEGEIRNLRWEENPRLLGQIIAGGLESISDSKKPLDAGQAREALLATVDAKEQKQARKWLEQIPALIRLQSMALHAFSYVQAGTRQWALAAAREAMTDNRLTDPDEIYFYALEEAKEMMTGEWNVSATDEIRAVAAQRRTEYNEWRQSEPAPILLNDAEGNSNKENSGTFPVHIVAESASGVFVRVEPNSVAPLLAGNGSESVILGVDQFESGSAALLPATCGILSANGVPVSPVVSIAAQHQVPIVMNARQQVSSLADGAQVTIGKDGI